ncbi:hypothetical protein NBRC116592_17880 [Colwellia sp. KU-HH00111]
MVKLMSLSINSAAIPIEALIMVVTVMIKENLATFTTELNGELPR